MHYLFLSVLSSALIYVTFKLLERYKVNTLYAIVINYYTACAAGLLTLGTTFSFSNLLTKPWLVGALLLGALFIGVFVLMAITTQRSGLSVVAVAGKMSVVIPISFVIFYYNEPIGLLKISGIFLALIAVYLASIKTTKGIRIKRENFVLPLFVFIGSGIIETLIKFLEENAVPREEVSLFSIALFLCAAFIGSLSGLVHYKRKRINLTHRELIGGFFLGIPNYFSLYFLILALKSHLGSATVFILNNVAVVLLSTLLGMLFFSEKLSIKNRLGIGLATVSILLIGYSG